MLYVITDRELSTGDEHDGCFRFEWHFWDAQQAAIRFAEKGKTGYIYCLYPDSNGEDIIIDFKKKCYLPEPEIVWDDYE